MYEAYVADFGPPEKPPGDHTFRDDYDPQPPARRAEQAGDGPDERTAEGEK